MSMLAAAIIAMAMLPRASGVHPQSDPMAWVTRADALIARGETRCGGSRG